MRATESRDAVTGVPIEQSDVPIYLPGTPSGAFVEYAELLAVALFR